MKNPCFVNGFGDDLPRNLNHFVAHLMPQTVVYLLKAVEVEQAQADIFAVGFCRERFFGNRKKSAAVQKPRQCVETRFYLKFSLDLQIFLIHHELTDAALLEHIMKPARKQRDHQRIVQILIGNREGFKRKRRDEHNRRAQKRQRNHTHHIPDKQQVDKHIHNQIHRGRHIRTHYRSKNPVGEHFRHQNIHKKKTVRFGLFRKKHHYERVSNRKHGVECVKRRLFNRHAEHIERTERKVKQIDDKKPAVHNERVLSIVRTNHFFAI